MGVSVDVDAVCLEGETIRGFRIAVVGWYQFHVLETCFGREGLEEHD